MSMASSPIGYAWRGLRRSPGPLVLAVLTLALGIGGATAMFAVVDAVLLNPLPYANSDRLRELYVVQTPANYNIGPDAAQYEAIRQQAGVFATIEAYRFGSEALTDGDPTQVASPAVSPGLLGLLGAVPLTGRLFTDDEAAREARVVLISERLWRVRFGGAPDVIGRRLGIEGVPHEIVGVLPARFAFPERTADVWHPLPARPRVVDPRRATRSVAVLLPGVATAAADAALEAVSGALRRDGALSADSRVAAIDLVQRRFGTRYRTELFVLLGAVLLVFVIACTNVAHLLLARAADRESEFAVMSALGASGTRVLGALLFECVSLAVLGGLAGALTARVLLATLLASAPANMQMLSAAVIGLDWRAFAFAAGLAAATCLIVGLLPALRIWRLDLIDALKGRAPSVAGDRRERWHRAMVVTQLALVLGLLATSGLLLRSFARLVSVSPGFEIDDRLVAEIQFPPERYRASGGSLQLMQELDRRLEAAPGVRAVTFSEAAPPRGGSFSFDLQPEAEGQAPPSFAGIELPQLTVAPDYFATLGVPIIAGRTFTPADGDGAIIVNTVLARRVWGDVSPIGRRFRADRSRPWRTVIGVVGDVKQFGPRDSMGDGMETYYAYPTETRAGFYALTVVTSGDAGPIERRLRSELKTLDPLLPILELSTMEARLGESVARPRFLLRLAGVFAVVASLLAAVGVYGTTAYWVTRRQRELGVRMALGSSPGALVRLVLGRGLRIAAWAGVLGIGGALLIGDVLQSMLFETTPQDPLVLTATVGTLAILVLAACAVPAIRASRVDPLRVLRSE
jgi:putative ABC transport system permease protein